jgi:hypothetical protein
LASIGPWGGNAVARNSQLKELQKEMLHPSDTITEYYQTNRAYSIADYLYDTHGYHTFDELITFNLDSAYNFLKLKDQEYLLKDSIIKSLGIRSKILRSDYFSISSTYRKINKTTEWDYFISDINFYPERKTNTCDEIDEELFIRICFDRLSKEIFFVINNDSICFSLMPHLEKRNDEKAIRLINETDSLAWIYGESKFWKGRLTIKHIGGINQKDGNIKLENFTGDLLLKNKIK